MNNPDFIYYDGAESKLKEIFNSRDFDEHTTWLQYQNNWPLYYHLTPLRKNLLNWIKFNCDLKGKTVLELGGGCGAITSFLVNENNFKKIVTVEGDSNRADTIRSRCKNAENLEVVESNIIDFKSSDKFDFVLVIGVLEYSGKYINREKPFAEFLKHSKSFLKEDGNLVLAIENQLGHKYLAGVNEDHYGIPYEGISNYPNSNGIRTFDKQSLTLLLNNCGFKTQNWFYPFPDYKMPNVIFSDSGLKCLEFDKFSLMDTPTKDLSFKGRYNFNEKEFLKLLDKNTNISSFMNSFLIFASSSDQDIKINTDDLLALKTNILRKKEYCITKFFKEKKHEIFVSNFPLFQKTVEEPQHTEKYYQGYNNLFEELVSALYLNKSDRFLDFIDLWNGILNTKLKIDSDLSYQKKFKDFTQAKLNDDLYKTEKHWLESKYLELIPNNILVKTKDDYKVIDLEWDIFSCHIPKQFVIDRGMHYLMLKYCENTNRCIMKNDHTWNLPDGISQKISVNFRKPNYDSLIKFDNLFFNYVSGESIFDKVASQEMQNVSNRKNIKIIINKILKYLSKVKTVKRIADRISSI